MIHLIGPAVLASALAGIGVYGLLARRNAVLVLIGAELLLNAANVLLITASALPPGGLAAIPAPGESPPPELTDPLLSGQVMAIFVITIAAAEIGVALAIVLLLFRARGTADLTSVQELGESATTYTENPDGYPDDPRAEPARTVAAIEGTP
jgi:NADH-quinone oxidoreductase subunit K